MKYYTNETAFKYDLLRSGHQTERKFELISDFIKQLNQKNLLIGEVGCGSGRLSYLLAKEFRNSTIKSSEANETFAGYAKENFNLPNLSFSFWDIEKSCSTEKFDVLVTIDVLHHLKHLKSSTFNIASSLKTGGFWIAIEPNIFNFYIFLFQLTAKNEKLFFPKKSEKIFMENFHILDKKYIITLPFWIKNPSLFLKKLEKKIENQKLIGGSVAYLLKKQ